jgi:oligogalacturonide lyase
MRWNVPGTIAAAVVAAIALCAVIPANSQARGQGPLLPGAAVEAGPPRTWIDADTDHRIVRLTNEPGSASLYFNQNG